MPATASYSDAYAQDAYVQEYASEDAQEYVPEYQPAYAQECGQEYAFENMGATTTTDIYEGECNDCEKANERNQNARTRKIDPDL